MYVLIRMSNRGQYGAWEEEIIEVALAALSGGMGLNCAALTYDVLKATPKGVLMGPTQMVQDVNVCSNELLTCLKKLKVNFTPEQPMKA